MSITFESSFKSSNLAFRSCSRYNSNSFSLESVIYIIIEVYPLCFGVSNGLKSFTNEILKLSKSSSDISISETYFPTEANISFVDFKFGSL